MAFTTKESLLAKVRRGDEVSWREFFETYKPLILLCGGDTLRQYIPKEIFKSKTRYKLSFFMKLKGVQGDKDHPRAGVTIDVRFCNGGKNFVFYPFKQALTGDMKWTRFEFEFTTLENVGKVAVPYIGFNLSRFAKGMVWLDHVEMTEVGK